MTAQDSDTAPAFGRPIRVYGPSRRRRTAGRIVFGLILLGGIGCALAGGYRWYLATTQYGPAVVGRWSTPWFISAGGLAALAIGWGIALWRGRGLSVSLFEAGLGYRRAKRRVLVPWKDIRRLNASAVRYGIFGLIWGGEMQVRLDLRDGGELRLTRAIADLPDLVEKIKQRIYPHLLASYTRAFNQGHALEFGPLTLNGEGVLKGGRLLPWNELAAAELDKGMVRLTPVQGGPARRMKIPAHHIPNLDVCLQLIQNLGQTA